MEQAKILEQTLFLSGELIFRTVPTLEILVRELLKKEQPTILDVTDVTRLDSAGVAYLEALQELLKHSGSSIIMQGIDTEQKEILRTFSGINQPTETLSLNPGWLEKLADNFLASWKGFYASLVLAADVFYWAFVDFFDHKGQKKGSFSQQALILGEQALPVVGLMALIIGFILSLQSAAQLRNFGANVFIADLLSISLVREMGPMMTAIIVAGRSGSAIASEIASMQVSEEIDALRMMAINPIRYVIIPKFHAMSLVLPLLVAFSILIGMFGGLLIAVGYLDLSLQTFISRAIDILTIKDIVISFTKSMFFAWVIVIIGSHFGLSVKGGAEGVGRATTNSVVVSIFAVVFFDAVFSLIYL
jgi:phospholipid/cholesterol/gamma-HCH transport system permease protein